MPPEIEKEIKTLQARLSRLEKTAVTSTHRHNGFDSDLVDWSSLNNRKMYLHHTIVGADAAAAANYSTFFINEIGTCYVSAFYEVHQTAGSDVGAVTVMLEKLTGTTAPGSGTDVLSSALSLKATANTVQEGTLTATNADRNLALGDRLALEDTGTLTAVANVTVFVELTLT